MRIVVVGGTGNVGTSLLAHLLESPDRHEVVGVARRVPHEGADRLRWVAADVRSDDLRPILDGADAVVHLAWAIQPSHDESSLVATNVAGSLRVFEAAAAAGVGTLVYASSVGAYVDGPKDRRVDERWPVGGIGPSFYARHKGTVERMLDRFSTDHPTMRVVRMRPSLIFKRGQASEAHRFFLGPLVPAGLLRPGVLRLLPRVAGLSFQATHTDDVAAAYRAALESDVAGAFNLAADPVLDLPTIGDALSGLTVPVPAQGLRALVDMTWRARLQPTPAGWLDMGLRTPLMATERAERLLGWRPTVSATDAVLELLQGIADGAGEPTPALAPRRAARPEVAA